MAEPTPAQLEALGDYPAISVGGSAILRGWEAFEAGEPLRKPGWPYLWERGWYAAKRFAEQLALVEEVRQELEQEENDQCP